MLLLEVARTVVVSSYSECQAAGGFTQGDVYATTGNYNAGAQTNASSSDELLRQHIIASDAKFQLLANQMTKWKKLLIKDLKVRFLATHALNLSEVIIVVTARFAKALVHMPKYAKMLKDLLNNKDKLLELANTPLNENCLAVLLEKLPKKLSDPRKFLIPCDFSELEECMALANLANRSVAYLAGIAEDVFVQVGKFMFPADFVVVDYDIDPCPVTADEKTQKKNDVKARSMLLMALPNEHLLTFNQYKDAKTFALSTESLDYIFNKLQKIVSQLAILGENISQEDLNLKFLRSMPSEWNTHVVVWRNKPDLDTMSFDDLYNNFKIVEQEVKGTASSSSCSSSQKVAFIQPNGSHLVHEDLEQIYEDDLEEMDLKWQLALLSMRTRKFFLKTSRKITDNYMADDEVPTNMALIAFSDFERISNKPDLKSMGPKPSKSVSEDISNEVRESLDAPLVEELVLDDKLEKKNTTSRNLNGGYDPLGGEAKGGKNTVKGTLKTETSVLLQTLDVLFCLLDFKLADESTGFNLQIPKKSNMYSVDMKNIIPKESLTCLVVKATLDESMLWHRRLGKEQHKALEMSTIQELYYSFLIRGIWTFALQLSRNVSKARTPQQNGVAKRRNMTLIEAAKNHVILARETISSQTTILMPQLWKDGSLFDSSSKNASNDEPQPPSDAKKKDDDGVCKESRIADQERPENNT
ncbi:hypothetical protein Tco_0662024 [Tanacetum coccineum]